MGHSEVYHSSKYVPPPPVNWDTKDDVNVPSGDDGENITPFEKHTDNQESKNGSGSPNVAPEVRVRGDSHIICHDAHLNQDGEALYNFLVSQAATPPTFQLHCSGSHMERRTRRVRRTIQISKSNTFQYHTKETYTTTVTDFSFIIDLTPNIISEPLGVPIYVVGDRNATYRGKSAREVDEGSNKGADGRDIDVNQIGVGKELRRKATEAEKLATDARKARLNDVGLPPWVHLPEEALGTEAGIDAEETRQRYQNGAHGAFHTFDDNELEPPSQSLRQWTDAYCSSPKKLKEFNFHKSIHGWDLLELRQQIVRICKANWDHQGNEPDIHFKVSSDVISIRPHNWLSRTLSHRVYKALLCRSLIYPLIIWPYKRWGRGGGGEWCVAGSAYAMAKWVHVKNSVPGETVEAYFDHAPVVPSLRFLRATPKGISRLEGMREAEWLSEWEDTIATLVRTRNTDTDLLEKPFPRRPTSTSVNNDAT
ncbi:hypothetical protein FRB93_004108 [Tulasnella sp. JGI-2019a]|nr:hypothetical protein FRB93_004108 [Tulasnella sp. JGI-2019a]